jgi:hypothetical protein
LSASADTEGTGSRSRRTDKALPVESTCTDVKKPTVTTESVKTSFGGSAAGTAAELPKGFWEGSLAIEMTGGSAIRIAAIGVGGGGMVTGASVGVPAGGAPGSSVGAAAGVGAGVDGEGVGAGSGDGACPTAVEKIDPASSAATGKARIRNSIELQGSI